MIQIGCNANTACNNNAGSLAVPVSLCSGNLALSAMVEPSLLDLAQVLVLSTRPTHRVLVTLVNLLVQKTLAR
jgi:hypothetical protein